MDGQVNNLSTYKVRIYGQAFVYQKRSKPKVEMETTEFGVKVPVENWYQEFECKQLATNINCLYVKRSDVDQMLKELNAAIVESLEEKGLIV